MQRLDSSQYNSISDFRKLAADYDSNNQLVSYFLHYNFSSKSNETRANRDDNGSYFYWDDLESNTWKRNTMVLNDTNGLLSSMSDNDCIDICIEYKNGKKEETEENNEKDKEKDEIESKSVAIEDTFSLSLHKNGKKVAEIGEITLAWPKFEYFAVLGANSSATGCCFRVFPH